MREYAANTPQSKAKKETHLMFYWHYNKFPYVLVVCEHPQGDSPSLPESLTFWPSVLTLCYCIAPKFTLIVLVNQNALQLKANTATLPCHG